MRAPYHNQIAPLAPGYDPRHVEAFMRTEHPTLDALRPSKFAEEVRIACFAIDKAGTDFAEQLAQSHGF